MPLAWNQFSFNPGRELGRGGLGIVDEITVTATNGSYPVGTKLARKRLNDNWIRNPGMLARFEREISALKTMRHSDILPIMGENLANGPVRFYCMKVYPESLRSRLLSNTNGFYWEAVARFGSRLANAFEYAHNCGFIHRDIKPENVLLDGMGNPVIADWGLGYFVHQTSVVLAPMTMAGMGTEHYCSIEQWMTGKCENTGDIYSLGMTLAELVLGTRPIIASVGSGITGNVVSNVSPSTERFNAIIKSMTAVSPSHRIQSMRRVSELLNSVVGE